MKEIYQCRDGQFKIDDPELGVHIEASFTPLMVPSDQVSVEGLTIQKDDKGNLLNAYFETEGKREGQSLSYYPDGTIESECYYSRGELHGPSRFYSEKGICLTETWFYFNKKVGKAMRYYLSGKLYCIERYRLGTLQGKQEYYFEQGTHKTIIPYDAGKIEGLVQLFWPSGNKKREVVFKKGVRDGFDRVWSERGVLLDEGHYLDGNPVDLHQRFYESGRLHEERHYYTPTRFDRKEWDLNGKLCLEGKYQSDLAYVEKRWQEGKESVRFGKWDGKRIKWSNDG